MERPTDLKGLEGLLAFVNFLNHKRIWYKIDHLRDDTLMVSFTMVGRRVEVDFFVDHIEFSIFAGDEGVEDNEKLLFDLIAKYSD